MHNDPLLGFKVTASAFAIAMKGGEWRNPNDALE
jgi:hypothetical protein